MFIPYIRLILWGVLPMHPARKCELEEIQAVINGLGISDASRAEVRSIRKYIKGTVPMIYNEICLRQMKFIFDE